MGHGCIRWTEYNPVVVPQESSPPSPVPILPPAPQLSRVIYVLSALTIVDVAPVAIQASAIARPHCGPSLGPFLFRRVVTLW